MPELYAGLMSGTSGDGIDAVIVDFTHKAPSLVAAEEFQLPSEIKKIIISLASPAANEIDICGELDRQLGILFADCINRLLANNKLSKDDIKAIGSHGQTIRHRPATTSRLNSTAFTLQIGDPNTIAELTGITTVADFRRRDIAAGGQGAPLAPAFHQAVFSSDEKNRAVINIGGMANITLLTQGNSVSGYDTGPGNVLMDGWISRHQQKTYDRNGDWAASGTVYNELLKTLLQHSYFSQDAPKSTGREDFNLLWLDAILDEQNISPQDVQATLLELTATSISKELNKYFQIDEVYICGGGAFNGALMTRLETLSHPKIVSSTAAAGIAPQWVEGCAFAWLAKQCIEGLPSNCPQVTGAKKDVILGTISPA